MASLLSGNRKSLLDAPIGVDESRARQDSERASQNEVQRTRRVERMGRRAYRQALRRDDGMGALAALEKVESMGGSMGGIKIAGADRKAADKLYEGRRSQIERSSGRTVDEQGRIASEVQSRILGSGDGSTPENAKASLTGGERVNTGPASNEGQDLSVADLGGFAEQDATARAASTASGAFGDTTRLGFPAPQPAPAAPAITAPPEATRFDSLVDKYAGQFPGIERLKSLSGAEKADSVQRGRDSLTPYETASPGGFTSQDKLLASDLGGASRILGGVRRNQAAALLQSSVNPDRESPSSVLARELLGGLVGGGRGFDPGASPTIAPIAAQPPGGKQVAKPASVASILLSSSPPAPLSSGALDTPAWASEAFDARDKAASKKRDLQARILAQRRPQTDLDKAIQRGIRKIPEIASSSADALSAAAGAVGTFFRRDVAGKLTPEEAERKQTLLETRASKEEASRLLSVARTNAETAAIHANRKPGVASEAMGALRKAMRPKPVDKKQKAAQAAAEEARGLEAVARTNAETAAIHARRQARRHAKR